jgi:starch synthase
MNLVDNSSAPAAREPGLRVLSVAAEMYPLIKTGGLADVVGALPAALADHDIEVVTLLPGYPVVLGNITDRAEVAHWPAYFGGDARLLAARSGETRLLVLEAPHLYARGGNPYTAPDGSAWQDNAERFAALAMAAVRIAQGAVADFVPDVLHAHDWHAALVPAYARFLETGSGSPRTVLTVHNLAFQGQFAPEVFPHLGLPPHAFSPDGVEFHGQISYLKAGVLLADAVTTVSPSYADEIRTVEGGMGLDAMLRWRGAAVSGIVNGIDIDVWNPATDPALAARYSANSVGNSASSGRSDSERSINKRAVEASFGLTAADSPLFCVISRLTWQKGIDLLVQALDDLVEMDARLVVLGTGDAALEHALQAAAARYPHQVAVRIGYDEHLSHLMQGGCDAILVPSRFEPCGLTQLYGLRYGCVPVVARVGGLADTVIDANDAALRAGVATGIQLHAPTQEGVVAGLRRAVALHAQPDTWRKLQLAGMRADVSWAASATRYAALYRELRS